jgi:hypothetical protein
MSKPKRIHKDDRLLHRGASDEEVRCDMALGPFDRAAREADLRWGVDRLPELVGPETAAKWGAAIAKLNAAIDARDPATVTARVSACLRGFATMDAEATAAGHKPIIPDAWEFAIAGAPCAVIRDEAAWPAYAAQRPGVRIYTFREVANALSAYGETVAAIKDAFPGATIKTPSPLAAELDDEIPY